MITIPLPLNDREAWHQGPSLTLPVRCRGAVVVTEPGERTTALFSSSYRNFYDWVLLSQGSNLPSAQYSYLSPFSHFCGEAARGGRGGTEALSTQWILFQSQTQPAVLIKT
jgi:hypothetical protein